VPSADPRVIEAYARELRGKAASSRVLALAADPGYAGPTLLHVDGADVHVRGCLSSLAIREFLVDLPADAYAIVLTDRTADDLGDALVCRFRRQRVEPLDAWATVPGLFAARHVAEGLRHSVPWLPGELLDRLPARGYPPSPTDTVTRDHVLGALTAQVLGIPPDDLGLGALLDRMGDLGARQAWSEVADEPREALASWVGERAGVAAGAVLRLVSAQATAHIHVLALGLMLDVLYSGDVAQAEVAQARHAWENGYLLPRVAPRAAAQMGAAARERLQALADSDPGSRHVVWRDTHEAFAVAAFRDGVALSPSHPDGYAARLSAVASAISGAIAPAAPPGDADDPPPTAAHLSDLEAATSSLSRHDLAWADCRAETEQVLMGLRLVRWLASNPVPTPTTLPEALQRHMRSDGWVDRAVADVWSGSIRTDVAEAYRGLCHRVLGRRRRHDEHFAALLAEATRRDVLDDDVLAVEDVLARTIEPISRHAPVLMIVIDGMSAAVAAAIADGISRLAWAEQVPAGLDSRAGVLAALPTITRYSRTSLLCGTLRQGTQADEKRAFTALTGGPLFHKDDLRAPAGAAVNPDVDTAIASDTRVVGVVLNTVDDALAKHDPDGTRWTVSAIQHLEPLLELARRRGRVAVLVSDHGHVVERGSRAVPRDLAEARWRPASTGPATDGEITLTGRRVLAAGGSIVAPWVEDLRYGNKAAGYHGGASAAEVTIPLLVFAAPDADLSAAGWHPAAAQAPTWWERVDRPARTLAPPAPAPRRPRRSTRTTPPTDDGLFALPPSTSTPTPPPGAEPGDPHSPSIDAFFASPVYARMRAAAGRAALHDAAVATALRVLLIGGGRAPANEVAAALGVPGPRLGLALSNLRRLLNVEGYPVVGMDADGRTVVLDEMLWRQQFGLAPR
jgi:hypothetical protein